MHGQAAKQQIWYFKRWHNSWPLSVHINHHVLNKKLGTHDASSSTILDPCGARPRVACNAARAIVLRLNLHGCVQSGQTRRVSAIRLKTSKRDMSGIESYSSIGTMSSSMTIILATGMVIVTASCGTDPRHCGTSASSKNSLAAKSVVIC
jgi:hypothetical protein